MRRGLLRASLALAFLFACPAIAQRGRPVEPGPADGGIRIRLPATITLEPVTVTEMLNGSSTTVPFTSFPPPAPVPPRIVREVADIWRVVQPPPHGQGAIQASYELRGVNGVADQLSAPGMPGSVIQVEMEVLSSENDVNGNGVITRGGVRFLLDVTQAQRAGPYQGTLTVVLNRL